MLKNHCLLLLLRLLRSFNVCDTPFEVGLILFCEVQVIC